MAAPKRRWDQAPDDPAKAVREKVQAQLAEKGLKFASKDGPSREIEINDSPHRFLLTKGTLHDEVRRLTGATVTTKGMFVANRAASKERGLYLLVQGTTQETVDAAAEWLGKVMSGQIVPEAAAQLREYQTGGGAQPPPPPGAPPPSGPVPQPPPASLGFDAKVFVGVEHSEAQAVGFSLIGKLFGQGGSFLKHISSSTGNTRVLLRGRYPLSSSPDGTNKNFADEPLHLALSAPSQAQVDAAKGLAENLIEHVRKEWNEHRERKSRAHGPGTGYRGPSHDGHAPHMHHPQQPQHMHAPQHQQQFQQPQHMHAPQHQAYQQQPGVAGGAVPAMDPYYAQYYMQQLYAYDPAAYYAYAAQYQPYAADQAAAAAPSAAPAAPDATPLGPARPTAAELAHSVAALPEAPPPPPPAAAEGDGHAKRRAEEAAAEEGEDEDEAAEAAHGAPAKRSAVDSAAKTGAPAPAAASAPPARPFWAPPNDAAPSPLLHKK